MSEDIKDGLNTENEINEEKPELDNPLVVHRKGDASYKENANPVQMNETHTEDKGVTLRRHRFRKEKKSHGGLIAVLVIIVILAGAFSALYFTGNIRFLNSETTTKKSVSTTEATTSNEEAYQGTIVIKNTYIFVNGVEVNGIQGLQKALEYEEKSTTAFTIIDEDANSDFLNYEVLQILQQMGFYGEDTVITHKESTGLIAEAETTTLPPEPTTTATTTKKETTANKN